MNHLVLLKKTTLITKYHYFMINKNLKKHLLIRLNNGLFSQY